MAVVDHTELEFPGHVWDYNDTGVHFWSAYVVDADIPIRNTDTVYAGVGVRSSSADTVYASVDIWCFNADTVYTGVGIWCFDADIFYAVVGVWYFDADTLYAGLGVWRTDADTFDSNVGVRGVGGVVAAVSVRFADSAERLRCV